MRYSIFSGRTVSAGICAAVLIASNANAQAPVVQLINGSGVGITDALSATGSTFTTNFKGTSDVTVTRLSSGSSPVTLNLNFTSSPGNNPSYLTNFVGSAVTGTGDGTAGTMQLLSSGSRLTALQFDFASGLVAGDRLVLADIDAGEIYAIRAFSFSGGVYTAINLESAVTHNPYTGQTGANPDSRWAQWDPTGGGATTGVFSAADDNNYSWPVNALTFNRTVDRIEIRSATGSRNGGAVQMQLVGSAATVVPEAGTALLLGLMLPILGTVVTIRCRK